jgi:hypothetical protein
MIRADCTSSLKPVPSDRRGEPGAPIVFASMFLAVVVSVRLAEEKEPLIHAAFGAQISANQRFLSLRLKVAQGTLNHYSLDASLRLRFNAKSEGWPLRSKSI